MPAQTSPESDGTPIGFGHLDPRLRQWLTDEQTVNERVFLGTPVPRASADKLPASLQPERRASWPQTVVWLDQPDARVYGPVGPLLEEAFGVRTVDGRVPLLLHPRPPASHRRLRQLQGWHPVGDVRSTPTSSYRSVLSCAPDRRPVILKLSMGAIVGRYRRVVDEVHLATAMLISRMLDYISTQSRRVFGLDWFPEPAGVVDAGSGEGWILRDLPAVLVEPGAGRLAPVFSLIARRGDREPELVELIRRDGGRAEEVVIEAILAPYVAALSYLLFVEGLHIEGHGQNVLLELGVDGWPTGRVVLRDLGDCSVSIPLRLARRRPLPPLGDLPGSAPFPLGTAASNHQGLHGRGSMTRAHEVIVAFGLNAFVWSINQSLARFFPSYDEELVRRRYLQLWRDAAMRLLPVTVTVRDHPLGIVTDEVIEHVVRRIDWPSLGAIGGHALPARAEPLLIGGRARRRGSPVYARLECEWGDLYVDRGLPAFFDPNR